MSWFLTLILAGSMITAGSNLPVADRDIYENQGVPIFNTSSETERFEKTYPFDPDGRIQVSNVNGSVKIEAWDNPQIYLEAIKYADSPDRLQEVTIDVKASPKNFRVEADYQDWNRRTDRGNKRSHNQGMLKVEFLLKVPRTAILDDIETVNGSVTVSDMTKYTKVSAVNGSVKGTNLRGTAKLETVNGAVMADFDRMEKRSVISLETVNGSVKLVVPSDLNAVIRADTLNGSIKNAFGLPVKKGEYVGRDLYGRVGDSNVNIDDYSSIKLSSVNGGLSIERQNDGKQQNPVTNLLPEKTSDNFDSDFQSDMREAEKDVRASLRTAKKDIAEARKGMQKAVKAPNAVKDIDIGEMNIEIGESVTIEALKKAEIALEKAVMTEIEDMAELKREVALTRRFGSQLNVPSVEQEKGSFETQGIPTITINAENASVSIRSWDQSVIKYSMTKLAKDQITKVQNRKAIQFRTHEKDADEFAIEIINDSDGVDVRFREPTQVHLEVFVPKKSNLRIVSNDELRVEGVSGNIEVEGADEFINLRDLGGKLILKAGDNITRLIGFNGELDTEMGDGELFLEGDFQKIHAHGSDGTIVLTIPNDTNASVMANTKRISGEGIELICEGENLKKKEEHRMRIGQGGKNFIFEMDEGQVIIRSLDRIRAGL